MRAGACAWSVAISPLKKAGAAALCRYYVSSIMELMARVKRRVAAIG
jgi:hypothetical protein